LTEICTLKTKITSLEGDLSIQKLKNSNIID